MIISIVITPSTILMGIGATLTVSGIVPLGYDIHEMYHGHCPPSRIAKIFADLIMCTGTAIGTLGYNTGNAPLMFNAAILIGTGAILRIALSCFSKYRGEHTNL